MLQGLLDVMVFFVGGITCQEARGVNEFNAEMRSSGAGGRRTIRVICGGDFISSGGRYCADLARAAGIRTAAD